MADVIPFVPHRDATNGPQELTRPRFPLRPRRRVTIDADDVVGSVLTRAHEIDQDLNRSHWLEARLQRYAKLRGWLPEKSWPWASCSNVHVPILMTSDLRANAGLHNVVMTLRPLLSAKAQSRSGVEREEKITQVVDYQLFLEPGPEIAERRLGDFITGGLQDGNGVAYTPWVRDERHVTETRVAPAIPPEASPSEYLDAEFRRLLPGLQRIEFDGDSDHRFIVTYGERGRPREATVKVFEGEDGALEIVVRREATTYDGPVALPLPIESVLVPTRCTNLQAPSEANPTGAPYVFLRWRYRLDDVRRLRAGAFNWLDAEGLAKVVAAARAGAGLAAAAPDRPEALQEQKDTIEGREHREAPDDYDEALGHLPVTMLLCFDRWDVDGDGLAEDVFWVVAEDARVLCEARLLTERWPALKPYRPLAEWCPIPTKDRWYGISLLELGESLYDLIKGTFDQAFDAWTVGNIPFFFYGAGSKLATDVLSVAPGQGIPVPGNPRETILFPNLPQRDQSGALGIIGLAMRFYESLMAQGQLQSGQVPTGKASALRTFGTTMALLQQGDVRADQMLIRLFQGLAQIALNFHRMNRRLLPPDKEIRKVGWDGPAALGYQTIKTAEDIDAEAAFDFKPEFLNSNPAVLRESLQLLMGVVIQPLAFQLGGSNARTLDRLIRDFIRALRLDPKRYWDEPAPEALPPVLAEEAIERLTRGQEITAVPLEGAAKHLAKLQAWAASDAFGLLPPEHVALAKTWVEQVAGRAQQERLAAAAAQFQQALQQSSGGAAGVPTTVREPEGGGAVVPAPEGAMA